MCVFACTQVLLEAQEMAVKNHNVEYKSNLYVGECAELIVLQCRETSNQLCWRMKKNKETKMFRMLDHENVWTEERQLCHS